MSDGPFKAEADSSDASQVGTAAILRGIAETISQEEFDGARFRFEISVEEKE